MAFTVKYKVTSKRDPDKVFESAEEFYAAHDSWRDDNKEEKRRYEGVFKFYMKA